MPLGTSNERTIRALSVNVFPTTETRPTSGAPAGPLVSTAAGGFGAGTARRGVGANPPGLPSPESGSVGARRGVDSSGRAAESGDAGDGLWAAAGVTPRKRVSSDAALSARRHRCRSGLGLGLSDRGEVELVVLAGDPDRGPSWELAAQDELGERVLEQALNGSLERACAERGIEPSLDEQLHGFRSDLEMNLLRTQSLLDLAQ